ncbi:MAG TPA: PepSY domain-containing protein, partial [Rhodanobacter sp.]|nr:PepSY domain-containing protein [Rhodanobacter sp.]
GVPEASVATAATPVELPASDKKPAKNLLPMKIFFALIALGLLVSVLSGLFMAWRFSRRPGLFGSVLVGGIAVPLLLLLF